MKPVFGSLEYIRQLRELAYRRAVNVFSDEIATHTVQLWLVIDDDANKAKPLGSAVLIEFNNRHYLLTAAHVMDGIDVKNLAFWDEQDLVQVSGHAVFLSNQAEINRMGDVAVWELSSGATSALLKHYVFLPFDRIKLDHHLETRERYFLLGYPASKSKKIYRTMTISIKAFKFFTRGVKSLQKMKHNQLDANVNFMLEYHWRKAQPVFANKRQIEQLPDPHGLSGCGLWYMDDDKESKLVGIMIGYNHIDSIMIASRIDLATEIIRKSFDNSIPSSKTIQVEWL